MLDVGRWLRVGWVVTWLISAVCTTSLAPVSSNGASGVGDEQLAATDDPAGEFGPSWPADGSALAYVSNRS